MVDAEVDVIPTGGGGGEATSRVGGGGEVIEDNGVVDLQGHAVVEGFLEVPGARWEVELTDEAAGGVKGHDVTGLIVQRAEVSRDDGRVRDGGTKRAAGEVEGAQGLVVVEGDATPVEDHGASASRAGHILADGEEAGVDRDATREGVARGVQRERAGTRLGDTEGTGDRAVEGQGLGGDVDRGVRRQGDGAVAEAQRIRTREVQDAITEGNGRGGGDVDVRAAGVVEGDARRERDRTTTEGIGAVDVEGAFGNHEVACEGVHATEGELTVASLRDAAGANDVLVDGEATADDLKGERAVERDIAVGVADEAEGLADVGRRVAEGTARGDVDGEVITDVLRVTRDDDRTAIEHSAGRVIRQLAAWTVGQIDHAPGGTRIDGHRGRVVVGRVEEIAGSEHIEERTVVQRDAAEVILGSADVDRASEDGEGPEGIGACEFQGAAWSDQRADLDRTSEGVRAREGQRTRADLIEAEGEARGVSDNAGEGRGGITRADREGASVLIRRDVTGTGEAADDFGAHGHNERTSRVDRQRRIVRDAVRRATSDSADLHDTRASEGHITREGVRQAQAKDRAAGADEGHIAGSSDARVVRAISGIGVDDEVALERDAAEAHPASAGDADVRTNLGYARSVAADEDGVGKVARGASPRDVERDVVGRGIGSTKGDATRAERASGADVDTARAEEGATGEGVGDASHVEDARAALDDLAVAAEGITRGRGQGVIVGRVIDDGGRRADVTHEIDSLGNAEGIIEGHDVTEDELVGQGGADVEEVVRGRIPVGISAAVGPDEFTEAEGQGGAGGTDVEGRGAAVATGTGEGEVGARGGGRTVIQDRERRAGSRTAEEVDRDEAARGDAEGVSSGEDRAGRRVGRERGEVTEGDRLGRAEALQVSARRDGEVGVRDIAREAQRTGADGRRTRVGLVANEGRRTRALLGQAAGARHDEVEGLRRCRGHEDRAAAGSGDHAAAGDFAVEDEAAGRVDGVEGRSGASHDDVRVDGDIGARRRVTHRAARPGSSAGEEIIRDQARARSEFQGTGRETIFGDDPIDSGIRATVIEDHPRGLNGTTGLVEDADAVDADIDTTSLLGAAVGCGTWGWVDHLDGTAREVIRADATTPVTDAHTRGGELLDRAARLVDRTTQISSFSDLNLVHLKE